MKEIQHQQLGPSAFNAKYHISPSSATTLLVLHTVGLVTECFSRLHVLPSYTSFVVFAPGLEGSLLSPGGTD